MPDDPTQAAPGTARCPGTNWEDILNTDTREVPAFLRDETYEYMGSAPLATARYTSHEFFQRENQKMWPRVWQFAARDEDMPFPGDFVVYENVGRSYLVVRQEDGSVKAFHNVCLHRGRKLRLEDGSASELKCPFHGFAWNTDGSFKSMPCAWDFPHLKPETMHLPEAAVATWAGYIFVREVHEGPTIEEYLAPLPEFFKRWRHEECRTAIWVGKVVPANWKATAEAFMEAWHTIETHPQIMPFTGDANTSYNVWGDNINAALTPFAVLSPHLDPAGKAQQWIVDEFLKYNGRAGGPDVSVTVPSGETARRAMASANRQRYAESSGRSHDHVTDSELLDAFVYNVFPNFSPWGGFMPNIVYRWRPWPDQDKTLMEVRILVRTTPDAPKAHGVEMKFLGENEPWAAAPELGVLGDVFDQDMANLPYVQDGMKVSKNGLINLGNYQEIRIRQFHRTLDKYLAG
ncbi:MAG TPA: aromatic ring-hydroxylating dioxygenase subunit alpha [Stellaceae bacterium]|nr:aromatic ring-hydroxylating dioxygenase subunit alpha [Stellaceae bacterium]